MKRRSNTIGRGLLFLMILGTLATVLQTQWWEESSANVDKTFDYEGKKRHLKVCLRYRYKTGCPASIADSIKAAINLWNAKLVSWHLTWTDDCSEADIKVWCSSLPSSDLGQWEKPDGDLLYGKRGAAKESKITINRDDIVDFGWCNSEHEIVAIIVHELGHAMRLDHAGTKDIMREKFSKTGHPRGPTKADSIEAATADGTTKKNVKTTPPGVKKATTYTGTITSDYGEAPLDLFSATNVVISAFRPGALLNLGWNILNDDELEWWADVDTSADYVEAFFTTIDYPGSTVVRQGFLHVVESWWDDSWRPVAVAPDDTTISGPNSQVILDATGSSHPAGIDEMNFTWIVNGSGMIKGGNITATTLSAGQNMIVLEALDAFGYLDLDTMYVHVGIPTLSPFGIIFLITALTLVAVVMIIVHRKRASMRR